MAKHKYTVIKNKTIIYSTIHIEREENPHEMYQTISGHGKY